MVERVTLVRKCKKCGEEKLVTPTRAEHREDFTCKKCKEKEKTDYKWVKKEVDRNGYGNT